MTNIEKIKNMTAKEMAEMLFDEANNSYNYCDYCPNQRYYAPHCAADDIETGCKNAIMQWLNEESEVDDNENHNKQKAR